MNFKMAKWLLLFSAFIPLQGCAQPDRYQLGGDASNLVVLDKTTGKVWRYEATGDGQGHLTGEYGWLCYGSPATMPSK